MQKEVRRTLRTPAEVAAERADHARKQPRYSYAEATAAAEAQIGEFLGQAAAGETAHVDYALGVYYGWMKLTALECTQDDLKRLDPLTRWKAMRAEAE